MEDDEIEGNQAGSYEDEESEDEDMLLADNTVQPGIFKNVDSIVCLGTEPDKAMVRLLFTILKSQMKTC